MNNSHRSRLTYKEAVVIFEGVSNGEEYVTIYPKTEQLRRRDDKTIRKAIRVASELVKYSNKNLDDHDFYDISENKICEYLGIDASYVRSIYYLFIKWIKHGVSGHPKPSRDGHLKTGHLR